MWLRLFGFAPDATVSFENVMQRIHPDDRETVEAGLQQALAERSHYVVDFRLVLPEGTQRWLVARGRVYADAQGKPVRMVGVTVDITERKRTEAELRDLSGRLINAHEEERARLARELHDDLTQRLAILAIEAGRVEREISKLPAAETLRGIREGLIRLSEDIHALSYRLHPSVLEDLGLGEALKTECEQFSRRESIPAAVQLKDLPEKMPRGAALCLFRVAQEALRNVARHARASSVEISLWRNDGGLQLSVRDNGVGFDSTGHRDQPSLGLASMKERVRLLGGELKIESAPGRGTNILAWLPVKEESL